ncbi:hypothetical protein FQN57_002646 [Myotisia sp. PD_48]|nr:hypothetical protein FQN57_002646 [Myotisia sp. PD_48]
MADTVKVPELALGIVNTTAWWIGTLGLGLAVQQFEENTSLSFLTSLVNHSITPSHSYGYTAGAYYRESIRSKLSSWFQLHGFKVTDMTMLGVKRVPSSLTFGGVDKTRFVENDVKFRLTDDNLPVLSIKSINMTTAPGKLPPSPVQKDYHYVSLNSDAPELYTIDSSTPYFWFPEHLCNSIAEYLQLTYNETIGLYTYGNNPSAFDSILSSNLTFTFNLVDNVGSSPVSISLPFRAFDHTLTYPFPNTYLAQEGPGIRYFPMKKTNNSAQYTIGRVFLQEAYLMVDYERSIFSVSQAKFPSDPQLEPEILPIYLPSTGLPMKFKVAIGIGVGIVIAMAISILVLLRYRRNRRRQIEDNENEKGGYRPRFRLWGSKKKETSGNKKQKFRKLVELPNNCPPPVEVPGDSPVGDIVAELPLSPVLVELEASERINGKPRGVRTANQIPLPQYEEVDSKIDAVDSDNLHLIHPAFRSPDPARIVVKHGQNEVSQDDRRPIHGTKPKSKQIRTKPHPIFTAARGTSS